MVRCESKNWQQKDIACLNEIGLCVQNMLRILGSIANMNHPWGKEEATLTTKSSLWSSIDKLKSEMIMPFVMNSKMLNHKSPNHQFWASSINKHFNFYVLTLGLN